MELDRFFKEIDEAWTRLGDEPIELRLIGSTALLLQTDYERGTKDSDLIRTTSVNDAVAKQLEDLAGEGTELHKRNHIFLDIVGNGVPFLPHPPSYRRLEVELTNFTLSVLDVVDVVVSKLKPFRPSDLDDIDAMVKRGLVPHEKLVARFKSAMTLWEMDAWARVVLPRCIGNLNTVERDLLDVEESVIELPRWL